MQEKPASQICGLIIVSIGMMLLSLGCTTSGHLVSLPEGVTVVSICSFFVDEELAGAKVATSGEVTEIMSGSFILRCRHDPTREIEVGTDRSPTKVENSGTLVTVYGTLAKTGKSPYLLADDLRIDGRIRRESGGDSSPSFGSSGGGGCH